MMKHYYKRMDAGYWKGCFGYAFDAVKDRHTSHGDRRYMVGAYASNPNILFCRWRKK